MFGSARILDRYVLRQTIGTLGAVIGIVMSLMIVEHFPRLVEITRLSGHRGYIVAQTVVGLLPEYAGIGLLVGLYLAIALTVRRLSMRGELDVIEAVGVSPWRWMRYPALLAVLVSALTFLNQGWLLPDGEARLAEIGHRMAIGDFGYNIQAGDFVDLGPGKILNFRGVDSKANRLTGLFLKDGQETFTAASGRLSMSPDGETIIELFDGQAVNSRDGRVFTFGHLRYGARKVGVRPAKDQESTDPLRRVSLDTLLRSDTTRDRSVVYGRLMWAALALLIPFFALVLGKPPRREAGSVGVFVGLALLVFFVKTIAPLTDGNTQTPGILSLAILAGWIATVSGLIYAEKRLGHGFVDRSVTRLIQWRRSGSAEKGKAVPRHIRSPRPAFQGPRSKIRATRGTDAHRRDVQPAL